MFITTHLSFPRTRNNGFGCRAECELNGGDAFGFEVVGADVSHGEPEVLFIVLFMARHISLLSK